MRWDAVRLAREKFGIAPDELQLKVLGATAKRGILNCTRQWEESMMKAAGMLRKLGIRPRGDGDNECSLLFPNGSRIIGLPGAEATLLLVDEAARVDDAMYRALRPMLAVGNGDLWLMSTPWGKRGFSTTRGHMGARSG